MAQDVIAAVDDLFFASRIRGTAEQLGVSVRFAKTAEAVFEAAKAEKPRLIIVDLHSQRCDPINLAQRLKSDETLHTVTLLGFFSHVQTDLQERAKKAGFDRLMPRSAFTKQLAEILAESKNN